MQKYQHSIKESHTVNKTDMQKDTQALSFVQPPDATTIVWPSSAAYLKSEKVAYSPLRLSGMARANEDHTVLLPPMHLSTNEWNEPYLPSLFRCRASLHCGRYSFPILLIIYQDYCIYKDNIDKRSLIPARSIQTLLMCATLLPLVKLDQPEFYSWISFLTPPSHHNTTVLRPFFRDHLGEPVPEENFWTLWCKGIMSFLTFNQKCQSTEVTVTSEKYKYHHLPY